MSALARIWRPRTFAEVMGQGSIVKALQHALGTQRLHHAYLFSGTRGVGKTTLGRLFAKALNCHEGITASPCGICASCQDIDKGRSIDLLEIDAASRTKVEDTRDLLENVQYSPVQSRFKVYLIDEVHMLSGHSFNALLKTLEEPPAHVKFLLATTDPQKLPVTVLSRCLQFHLQPLSIDQLVTQLAGVLEKESLAFDKAALPLLAKAARGSVRDALSLLDQAIAIGQGGVQVSSVQEMLGLAPFDQVLALVMALLQRSKEAAWQHLQSLLANTTDFLSLHGQLLEVFYRLALAQTITQLETDTQIQQMATMVSPEETQLYYQIVLTCQSDLTLHPTPKVAFEMMVLRLLAFAPVELAVQHEKSTATPRSDNPEVAKAVTQPSNFGQGHSARVLGSGVYTGVNEHSQNEHNEEIGQKGRLPRSIDAASWPTCMAALSLAGITQALVEQCAFKGRTGDLVEFIIPKSQSPLLHVRHEEKLAQQLSQYLGETVRVKIMIAEGAVSSPLGQKEQQAAQVRQVAEAKVAANPEIQSLMKTFNASIQQVEPLSK